METHGSCVTLVVQPLFDSAAAAVNAASASSAASLPAGSSSGVLKRHVARRGQGSQGHVVLSPNEESQLAQEELQRRRKLRLQQVREQERYLAVCVRQRVQKRRGHQEVELTQQLHDDWTRRQQQRTDTLSQTLTDTLNTLGQAHTSAKENEPDWEGLAQKKADQKRRAEQRHTHALQELRTHTHTQEQESTRHIEARRRALEMEKERAAKVANMPTRPDPLQCVLQPQKKKSTVLEQMSSHTLTPSPSLHTHIHPEATVETHTAQADAVEAGQEEGRRLERLEEEVARDRLEQQEKARLRGEHALKKELHLQERQRMLLDLHRIQKADWLRRKRALHQAPPTRITHTHPTQTTHAHPVTHTHPAHTQATTHTAECDEERQIALEHAFQDLYTTERRVKGDLVLQLVPEPLPAPSPSNHDDHLETTLQPAPGYHSEELEVTLESEDVTLEGEEHPEEAAPVEVEVGTSEASSQSHGLSRLLQRIRTQRDHWTSCHQAAMTTQPSDGGVTMATQPSDEAVLTTTEPIEVVTTTTQLRDQAIIMTTQPSDEVATATQPSDEVATATQPSDEVATATQPSDEVAMSLESGLMSTDSLDTGLREDSASAAEQVCPSADPHVVRLQQYQQQLLEQNRRHRQCVDEARRRLDEYQRTLTLRHLAVGIAAPSSVTMATTVTRPPVAIVTSATTPPVAVETSTTDTPVAIATPDNSDISTTGPAQTHTSQPHTHTPADKRTQADTHSPTHTPPDKHTQPYTHTPTHTPPDTPPLHPAPASPDDITHSSVSDSSPAPSQVLLGPDGGAESTGGVSAGVGGVALPPAVVVLELLRSRRQQQVSDPQCGSLMSVLLRAIQDSTNHSAHISQPANDTACSSQPTNHTPSSLQAANQSSRRAPAVPPPAHALRDWHQLSAILEVDTPLNSTVREESMLGLEDTSSVSLPPHTHTDTHSDTHTHSGQSSEESQLSHTHSHSAQRTLTTPHTYSGRASRLSWRDTLRLASAGVLPDPVQLPGSAPEVESPVDGGFSFSTSVSTGSYNTHTATDSSSSGRGGGVTSSDEALPGDRAERVIERHRMDLLHSLTHTGCRSWAELLHTQEEDEDPSVKSRAASDTSHSSGVFLPLQPQSDTSLLSSSHLQRDQEWDVPAMSRIIGQLSRLSSTSSQSNLTLPQHSSTILQSDHTMPHYISTSNQSNLPLPQLSSTSDQSNLTLPQHISSTYQSDFTLPHHVSSSIQSDLSMLSGQQVSLSSESLAGGRSMDELSSHLIGEESSGLHSNGRSGCGVLQPIGQLAQQEPPHWLADKAEMGSCLPIGQDPTLQVTPPDNTQHSSDSFHPLEAELTLGHLSSEGDDPALFRSDPAQTSQHALQVSLLQPPSPLTLDQSQSSALSLSGHAHSAQLSQSEMTSLPLWDRIMEVGSGRGILEESMLSLVSLSDVTLQSLQQEEEEEDTLTPTHTPTPQTHNIQDSHTHPSDLQEEKHTHASPSSMLTHTQCTHTQQTLQQDAQIALAQVPTTDLQSDPAAHLVGGECVLKRVEEVRISPEHTPRFCEQIEEVRLKKELQHRRAAHALQQTLQKLRAKHKP
ncbi:serine-rich adhesin for platelets isoform X2 [Engraulis encrasicolus]|uniref:serine-rich adhesin for platelets isoform X2 n=1 Tax=Engraulis encrasicolus TaxID=184585 RepID=UPI002FD773E8